MWYSYIDVFSYDMEISIHVTFLEAQSGGDDFSFSVVLAVLDFSSMQSVRCFGSSFLFRFIPTFLPDSVDVLVNFLLMSVMEIAWARSIFSWVAAFLASSSVLSCSIIPTWLGIQTRLIFFPVFIAVSRTSLTAFDAVLALFLSIDSRISRVSVKMVTSQFPGMSVMWTRACWIAI